MLSIPIILAQDEAGELVLSKEADTRLILFLAYGAVILLLLGWAILIRKQKNKRRRIYRHQPHTWQLDPTEEKEHRRRRRRERRRRSAHPKRQTNSTLAQSGGLPPRRPEDVPPAGL
jgi:Flp pilus assembly protein TadB